MKHTWLTRAETSGSRTGEDWYDEQEDVFARDAPDPHNGPQCKVCGYNFCTNCHPEGWEDDSCQAGAQPPPDGPAMSQAQFDSMAAIGRMLGGAS